MKFIFMDLIGELHPKSSTGNSYTFVVIGMLTGYSFCITIKYKSSSYVVNAYINNVCPKFSGSHCTLSGNMTTL